MINARNGTLSPVSTVDSNDWSPIARYHDVSSDNPYSPSLPPNHSAISPPASVGSAAPPDGPPPSGMPRPSGNPSPPSSVGRSSDGAGLYAAGVNDAAMNRANMAAHEDTLAEHYRVLKNYLGPYLRDEKGNPRPSRAKDKLTRLSAVQFQELSTDVYDESIRREVDRKRGGPGAPGNDTPNYLLPKNTFHPKRNQARQKLSTLPLERFRQLATDVFYELERRFPRFNLGSRSASPAGSMMSQRSNRGPPSRTGTPNGMRGGRPPPGGFRNGPPGPGGPGGPGGMRPDNFGRPLPKTFQQNTIVPAKGTMVEDDDSGADDEEPFNLEGAAARRQTNKSGRGANEAQDRAVSDLRSQVTELQEKLESLESDLKDKDEQLRNAQDAHSSRDSSASAERAEWDDLRYSLEQKVETAEDLNTSLRNEIARLREENESVERDLQARIADLELNPPVPAVNAVDAQRYEQLEQELSDQQQITEEVRREAQTFLQEMRELSARSDEAYQKEERLSTQVKGLEAEVKDWKSRYARAKTQLRTLKASSMGLASLASPDLSSNARDAAFTTPDGMIKDIHVTKFQLSIDELLQVARRADAEQLLDSMKNVVKCVRAITGDIDSTPLSQMQSPSSSVNGDSTSGLDRQQSRLKSRVSATANNLITATKNHASSGGLAPVSLLDAACSHLSTAIVELVKLVKVRPTPEHELQQLGEEEDRPMPLRTSGYPSYGAYAGGGLNGTDTGMGHQRHRSKGGSSSSTRYSEYSSPYSGYDRQSTATNGGGFERDVGMTQFKNYLEDQTALLVQSIQPLVNLIRSTSSATTSDSTADDRQIRLYLQDISRAVDDTATRTYDAVRDLPNPALKKHAPPVVEVLEECRRNMLDVELRDGGREKIPPLAFRTARALKELVLRVDRIDGGELTVDMPLKNDF